jgi:hypothetical protein
MYRWQGGLWFAIRRVVLFTSNMKERFGVSGDQNPPLPSELIARHRETA